MKDMDIAIVCLNAGIATVGPTAIVSDQEHESVVRVNALHPVYLGKILLEKQIRRV